MDDKQVKIMLMFGSDASKAEAGLTKLMQRFKQLEQRAEEVRQTLKVFRSTQQDTSALEKELNDVEQEMRQISDAAREAQSEIKGITKGSQDIRDNLYNLRDIGEKISQAGRYLGGIGNAILSPLTQASQLFLSTAAQSDPLVVRWKSEMGEIQDAWLRIGRVATEELLPLLENASDFIDTLADFVEAHPELVKIALGAGVGLKAAGEALQAFGSIAMLAGTLKQLGLAGVGGWLAGAGKTVGTLVTSAGGAGVGGLGLGLVGYEAIAQSEYGKERGLANLGQFASVGAYGLGKVFGGDELGQAWFRWMGELTGVLEKQTDAAQQDVQSMEGITQAQLDAFSDYENAQNQRKQYEQQSEEARNAIVAEFSARRTELEQSFESQRAQIISQYASQRANLIAQFSRNEQRTEEDYYEQRVQAAKNHSIEMRRMEEDHQHEMRKLQRDHNRRVKDLVDERDALGLVREQQSYEDQRQEAEKNYRIQVARRNEDLARQLQEMDENFALQRQRRLDDYQLQLRDMAEQHQQRLKQLDIQRAEELKRLDDAQRERLQQFDQQYRSEMQQLKNAEQNRLNTLRTLALNDQASLQKAGMELTTRYKAWLEQQIKGFTGGNLQPRAMGGAVDAMQSYLVGEQGPELFIPGVQGMIVPNSLTKAMFNNSQSEAKAIHMRVETSSLTLNQVLREVERMLSRRDRSMMRAMGG